MSLRSQIISQFESVAKEQNQNLPQLSDNLVLLESGLDSLCFAVIVARLEDELGFDPFTAHRRNRISGNLQRLRKDLRGRRKVMRFAER